MSRSIDNLLEFSDEVLLHILSHLKQNVGDLVHASHSCTKLDSLLQDKSVCEELTFHWYLTLERLSFVKFLQHPVRSTLITRLNLNDLYWIPSSVLRNIVLKTNHLQELHVAGTVLSWVHLLQILKSNAAHHIRCLSYSWHSKPFTDSALALQNVPETPTYSRSSTNSWKAQIDEVQELLQRLRFLLIHIPEVFNTDSLIIASYSSLSYFISMCSGLEQLQIFSWPKTIQELKYSTSIEFNEQAFLSNARFPNLHTFVLSVLEPQRIILPHLVSCMLRNISENQKDPKFILKNLWLDYPLLERQLRQDAKSDQPPTWPLIDFRKIDSCSIPLLEGLLARLNFDKCKTVQLTPGAPRLLSLNSAFEKTENLESLTSKSFNYRLDWAKLFARNTRLTTLNVYEDSTLPYPGFCLAASTLANLSKLALPVYTLLEIKDPGLRAQYCDSVQNEDDTPSDTDTISFKRKRIGSPSINGATSSSISGLNILTQSCPEIAELELGFCKIENRPGKILTSSLFSITRWRNLRKLTLDQLPITTGSFLIEIAQPCRLESLRLSHLGPRAKCIYVMDLCKAISCCDQLVDFRLEQNFIGNSRPIFKALESCSQLRRALVLSELNDRPLEEDVLPSLMNSCQKLSVLYVIIGSTPKYLCNSIRLSVESTFKRTRPSLSIVVRNSTHGESAHYPSIHYRQLVLLLSQVGNRSDFTAES